MSPYISSFKWEPTLNKYSSKLLWYYKYCLIGLAVFIIKPHVLHTPSFTFFPFFKSGFWYQNGMSWQFWHCPIVIKNLISTNSISQLEVSGNAISRSLELLVSPASFYHCSSFITWHVSSCVRNPRITTWIDRGF